MNADTVRADFRSALVEYIRAEAKPVDKFSHQPRLYRLAVLIGQGQVYDDDVLFAAAWLHDLGVFVGHRPEAVEELARWDHVVYAMKRGPSVLAGLGFPSAKIPATLEAIRTHLPDRVPTTVEGTILRDADLLEQLGAVGIMRVISKIGRDTRYPGYGEALATLKKNAACLPPLLQLPRARQIAETRAQFRREFLAAAEAEALGAPFD